MNRTRRDTVENLYKSCRMGGDCPPDVVNKVERKTLADILLQVFSSVIYLGGLGIGSGKGSTGNVGVRPIPEIPPVRRLPDTTVVEEIPLTDITVRPRPPASGRETPFSVPIDRIGAGFRPRDPTGIKPIDVVDPSSPSIVTLQEGLPDSVITISDPNLETGDTIVANIDVITDTSSIASHPTVIQGFEENISLLAVNPAVPPPTEVVFSISEPTVDPFITIQSIAGHIDPSFNVYVDPNSTGDDIIFGEEIPLDPITPRAEFEIEDIAKTSTPEERIQRAFNQARQFYRKHIQQVRTRNLNFLGDVSRAVQFGFENPAFDPEITLEFEKDLGTLAAAPDSDFADITKISRPYITSTPEGTVRVSRLAERAGMSTRSGTVLSQNVHYYFDISEIPAAESAESYELRPLSGVFSEPTNNVDIMESVFVNELEPIAEEELMDVYNDNFSDAHLIFNNTEQEDDIFSSPALISDVGVRTLPLYSDIIISEPNLNRDTTFNIPPIPYSPLEPSNGIIFDSVDFYLHPSLRKRKRKKRKLYF